MQKISTEMIIFDGRAYAQKKEEELKEKVSKLKFTPKLVSILVGDDPASVLYTNLKKKAAERVGIEFEVKKFKSDIGYQSLIKEIRDLNENKSVHGVMVQLPLPVKIENWKLKILGAITPSKDVDGLTKNSPFMPATTKAVLRILGAAKEQVNLGEEKVVVLGAKGMVGKSIVKELKNLGYKVIGVDKEIHNSKFIIHNSDIIISATGKPNLIRANMIKEKAAVIDVGSPKADADKSVYEKASFVTPVPGGVGPVTIVSLLENLVQPLYNSP